MLKCIRVLQARAAASKSTAGRLDVARRTRVEGAVWREPTLKCFCKVGEKLPLKAVINIHQVTNVRKWQDEIEPASKCLLWTGLAIIKHILPILRPYKCGNAALRILSGKWAYASNSQTFANTHLALGISDTVLR